MSASHLLFVVGSTATGKSDLAVEIAERAQVQARTQSNANANAKPELINSDSVAFFDHVQIGAAKPSPELLARAKHHLVGHIEPPNKYTAGDFRRDAIKIVEANPGPYIVVGGSGFYIQALEKGMYDVKDPDPTIKSELEKDAQEKGFGHLHEELKTRDPETKIQPADHYRIQRALEILRAEPGKTMNEIKAAFELQKPANPFTSKKIGLMRPRDVLRQRITERTQKMMRDGLIDEVIELRKKGLSLWAPMQSVGYKEVQSYLDGTLPKADLEPLIITSTMKLAKQQMTWFKRDPSTLWFDSDTQWAEAVEKGVELLTL